MGATASCLACVPAEDGEGEETAHAARAHVKWVYLPLQLQQRVEAGGPTRLQTLARECSDPATWVVVLARLHQAAATGPMGLCREFWGAMPDREEWSYNELTRAFAAGVAVFYRRTRLALRDSLLQSFGQHVVFEARLDIRHAGGGEVRWLCVLLCGLPRGARHRDVARVASDSDAELHAAAVAAACARLLGADTTLVALMHGGAAVAPAPADAFRCVLKDCVSDGVVQILQEATLGDGDGDAVVSVHAARLASTAHADAVMHAVLLHEPPRHGMRESCVPPPLDILVAHDGDCVLTAREPLALQRL